MRKSLAAIFVVTLIAVVLFVFLEPTGGIRGRLSGETFCQGRPVSYWRSSLSADPARRDEALRALKEKEAIPILREFLKTSPSEPDATEVRLTAIDLLSDMEEDASAAGPEMMALLQDSDPLIPSLAAAAVPKIGVPADEAIPELTKLIDGPAAVAAIRAISVYKGEGSSLVPKFEEILTDASLSTEVRWNAARTIGKIGPNAIDAVPTLIKMLDDPEVTIREHSAEAIGDIGPTAAFAIPDLLPLLKDENTRIRRDTVRSFGFMGPAAKETLPEVIKLLDDPEFIVKEAAKTAILSIDPSAMPKPKKKEESTKPEKTPTESSEPKSPEEE